MEFCFFLWYDSFCYLWGGYMGKLLLPKEYQSQLDILETQKAIKLTKDVFEKELSQALNLIRVSAPLYVEKSSGLNDGLSGVERPVSFDFKHMDCVVEVVQSLAKWKRNALKKYNLSKGMGLYTDMNAIRRDEEMDNLHSTYVDQWDFELVIGKEDRHLEYLKGVVCGIVSSLLKTQQQLQQHYPFLIPIIHEEVYFITSEELLRRYPHLDSKQREDAICKEYKTVFVMQIGDLLSNGDKHDGRAFDYDDWSLNGDLLVWYPLLERSIELSSMGIRVDQVTLKQQQIKAKVMDEDLKQYHHDVLHHRLPLTMGGGIGQSRICMVLLNKAHVGEVHASIWPASMVEMCLKHNIFLL